jgi:hypothetical protein
MSSLTWRQVSSSWPAGPRLSPRRAALAWALGVAGLLAYNWWVLALFKPGLMTSPDELFSNLEVSGHPYSTAMSYSDMLAGALLVAAFIVIGGRTVAAGLPDWLWMLVFAIAGTAGGAFPEVCEDGVSAVCRRQEWHFQLPVSQYVHIVAGIAEFAAITVALFIAMRRTRGQRALTARSYRRLWQAALVGYPLLGLAYLTDRLGAVMEAVFFIGFTVMVVTELAERIRRPASPDATVR